MLGVTDPDRPGDLMYSGLLIDPDTAADLTEINLERRPAPAVARTLVVTRAPPNVDKLVAGLHQSGNVVDLHACPQMQSMLDVPTGEDSLPENFIEPIMDWLDKRRPPGGDGIPTPRLHARLPWKGGLVCETFMELDGLTAVRCEPSDHRSDTAVVFLNSGADPHVGPGRAWVAYSRELALQGYACFRTDFSAFGESPDGGRAPGRPYDPHCLDDTLRIVAALRTRYQRVVLAGLCVGGWFAIQAAQAIHVDGVFALNPQLWWKPGLPIIIRIPDTIAWRAPMRRRQHWLARVGWYSLLDVMGIRPMASRWLIALRRRHVLVMLSYAENDDGFAHLRDCCARRVAREQRAGWLTLEEVTGIDHPMFKMWRRPAVVAQMLRFLDSLPPAGTAGGP
jgi:hypothetical protein